MAMFTRAIGKMTEHMAGADTPTLMAVFTRDIGLEIGSTAKD